MSVVPNIFSELMPAGLATAEPIRHGRNGSCWKVTDQLGVCYFGKYYFRHPGDPRNRLETEFNAFRVLGEHGETQIPTAISCNDELGIALYSWVAGSPPLPETITACDVDGVANFFLRLQELRPKLDMSAFRPASEACFSFREIAENIRGRLDRLKRDGVPEPSLVVDYQVFLQQLEERYEMLMKWMACELSLVGINPDEPISASEQVLSPSDFGFHNVLRLSDEAKRLVFVDFEYFGWDDPVKTVADFLLHPGTSVPLSVRKGFLERVASLGGQNRFRERLATSIPLYALKWCTILLNEFLPAGASRRRMAGESALPYELQRRQLDKVIAFSASCNPTYAKDNGLI